MLWSLGMFKIEEKGRNMGFELDLVLFWIGKMKLIFKSLPDFFSKKEDLSFETSVYFS